MPSRARAGFVLRRMGSARQVLAAAALTSAVCSAATAAAAAFATAALPEATHAYLSHSRQAIAVQGQVGAAQADSDARAIRAALRWALGPRTPIWYASARWSDPLSLPGGAGHGTTQLAEAMTAAGLRSRTTLAAGRWPGPPSAGQPVPAAALAAVASRLRLIPGQVLRLRDSDTGAAVAVRITGVLRPKAPAAAYWRLNIVGSSGASAQGGFVTYGPLIVDPAAFSGGRLTAGLASWVAAPSLGAMPAGSLAPAAGRLAGAAGHLQESQSLGGLTVSTSIPALLAGAARTLRVARSLMAVTVAELILLATSALALAARLLASQREGETALLTARGASRGQLLWRSAAETALLTACAAGTGVALAGPLAGLLARSGPLRSDGLRMAVTPAAAAWWAAAATFALSATVLLWPVLRPGRAELAGPGRRRPAALAGAVAAGGDLALIALALLAGWQLHLYSAAPPAVDGGAGVDPVLVIAPALALAGGAVAALRLLPLAARGCDRLAARGRRLGLALPGWQIARQPARHSGPALLVSLAVATATLALAQHASWLRSAADQASFQVGADARLDTTAAASLGTAAQVVHARGVRTAMPAAWVGTSAGEVLALDPRRARAVVLLRRDLAGMPAAGLWRTITPTGPAAGVALPDNARLLTVTARLGPHALRMGPATVSFTVQDAAGDTYSVAAGSLPADARPHPLTARLASAGPGIGPLRLIGLTAQYSDLHPTPVRLAWLGVDAIDTRTGTSSPGVSVADGGAVAGWVATVTAPPPQFVSNPQPPSVSGWRASLGSSGAMAFFPGYFLQPHSPPPPVYGLLTMAVAAPSQIPAIATRAYLSAAHRRVGALVPVAYGTAQFLVKVVAVVSQFPAVPAGGGALIVDERALQDVLAASGSPPAPVGEWWLRTSGSRPPAGLPAGALADRARRLQAQLSDPLSGGPQQGLLALVAVALALTLVGAAVSVTATVTERRAQSALLAAFGVSRFAQARMLCAEQLALCVPAAAAGTGLGTLLAVLMVPALTLDGAAGPPRPPALVQLSWPQALTVAAVAALVPPLLAAASVLRRPDPAAELRAAETG